MTTLADLTSKLYEAKQAEDAAKEARILIEEAIACQVDTAENGSKTVDCGNGLKVTVKRAISYSADVKAIQENMATLKDMILTLRPAEYEFNEKAYEVLRVENPTTFAQVAKFVVTKPRKVAVTLKLA